MADSDELLAHFIDESHCDEVGLWYIVRLVRSELNIDEPAEIRRVTLEFVRKLLKSGEVEAASYDSVASYRSWSLPIEGVVERISREWDELGREPTIADIVVFVGKDAVDR